MHPYTETALVPITKTYKHKVMHILQRFNVLFLLAFGLTICNPSLAQVKEVIIFGVDSHISNGEGIRIDLLVNKNVHAGASFRLVNYEYAEGNNFILNPNSYFVSEVLVDQNLYPGESYTLNYNIIEGSIQISKQGEPTTKLSASLHSSISVSRDPLILHLVKGQFIPKETSSLELYGKVIDGAYFSSSAYGGGVPMGIDESEYAAMFEDDGGGFTGITDLDVDECCLYDDEDNNGNGSGFETNGGTFDDDLEIDPRDKGRGNCCPPNTLTYEYDGCNVFPEGFPCEEEASYFIWYDMSDPNNPVVILEGPGHAPPVNDLPEGDYQLFTACQPDGALAECEYTLDIEVSCPVECNATLDVSILGPLNNCYAQANINSCPSAAIEWYANGQLIQSGGTQFIPTANGTYEVVLTNCPDCPVLSESFTINCFIACGCDFDISQVDCNFLNVNISSGCQGYTGNWKYSANGAAGSYSNIGNNALSQAIGANGHYRYVMKKNGCPDIRVTKEVTCVNTPICPSPASIFLQDEPSSMFTTSYLSGPFQNVLDNDNCMDTVYLFEIFFQGINIGDQGLIANVSSKISIEDINGNPLTLVTATDFPNDQDAIVIKGLENGTASFEIIWCHGTSYAKTYHFNVEVNCCPDRNITFSSNTQTIYCNSLIQTIDDFTGNPVQGFNPNIFLQEDNNYELSNLPNFVRYYFDYSGSVYQSCNGSSSVISTFNNIHVFLGAFYTSASLDFIEPTSGNPILLAGDHLNNFYYTNGFTGTTASVDLSSITLGAYTNNNDYILRVNEWLSQISSTINSTISNSGYTPVLDFHIVIENANGTAYFKSYISEKANYIGCSDANFLATNNASSLELTPSNQLKADHAQNFSYWFNNVALGCQLNYFINFPPGAPSNWLLNATYDYNYVDLFANNPQLVNFLGDNGDSPSYTCSTASTTTTITAEIDYACESPSYFWTTSNGRIVSGQFTETIEVDMPGDYLVTIICDDGCSYTNTYNNGADTTIPIADIEDKINLQDDITSIADPINKNSNGSEEQYKIFPNPAKNVINIKGNLEEKVSFNLYDIQGRLLLSNIRQSNSAENIISISTAKIAAGSYILKIRNGLQKPIFHKVIIAK